MRQAQELISGPNTAASTTLMSFNRAQSRVAIGPLTGHNTLRRHLHIMGLVDSPLCRECGAGEETSAHVLCECEALATLRHIYLESFFLDPENVRDLSLRVIWNFFRRTGLLWLGPNEGAQRACEGLRATGPWGLDPYLLTYFPAIWWWSMKLQCGGVTETDSITVYIRWAYCLLSAKGWSIWRKSHNIKPHTMI
jgi:hypothetical protein